MRPWEMMRRFGPASAGSGPSDPTAAAILAKLTSWWEMDEASGARNDAKGSNHLATVGTVSTGVGVRGTDVAASFGGAGGLTATSAASLQVPSGGGAHCLFGWAYFSSVSGARFVACKSDNSLGGGAGLEYALSLQSGTIYGQNGGSAYYNASRPPPATGSWGFYVLWRDPADGKVRLSINNEVAGVSSSASNPSSTSNPLRFGYYGPSPDGNYISGRLQRWGWIKGAILTADERTWLYNSGAGRTFSEITS